MMKKIFFTAFTLLGIGIVNAQDFYLVKLKEKENTQNYLSNPLLMLSQESLDRRAKYNVKLDEKDVPVSEERINKIKSLDLDYNGHSKWLNSVLVSIKDASVVEQLHNLDFVESVESLVRNETAARTPRINLNDKLNNTEEIVYGEADNFIKKMKLETLHSKGFKGKGLHIAVIDGGFIGMDTISKFNHVFDENRIKDKFNYVANNDNVYQGHEHGTNVITTMAVNLDGQYVGTAPDANYSLYVTENVNEETLKEWIYWVQAAERADQVGADIIRSSLGYIEFDDARYNYTTNDLDGKTTFISQAAKLATTRGILVLVAAGNYGFKPWKKISFPADPEEVFTVGSLLTTNVGSGTTSFGPNANRSVKPDIAALGVSIRTIGGNGNFKTSSGTSFSTPTVAGTMASLINAFPKLSLETLKQVVRESGHLYPATKDNIGYGYPDFAKVYDVLSTLSTEDVQVKGKLKIYPNPTSEIIHVQSDKKVLSLEVISMNGQLIKNNTNQSSIRVNELPKGVYLLRIVDGDMNTQVQKFVKN